MGSWTAGPLGICGVRKLDNWAVEDFKKANPKSWGVWQLWRVEVRQLWSWGVVDLRSQAFDCGVGELGSWQDCGLGSWATMDLGSWRLGQSWSSKVGDSGNCGVWETAFLWIRELGSWAACIWGAGTGAISECGSWVVGELSNCGVVELRSWRLCGFRGSGWGVGVIQYDCFN